MKKLLVLIAGFSLIFMVSCGPSAAERWANEEAAKQRIADSIDSVKKANTNIAYLTESVFIIDDIRADQVPNFMQYHVKLSDNTSLGSSDFWFRADANRYKLGDPLILIMKPIRKGSVADTIVEKNVNTINKTNK